MPRYRQDILRALSMPVNAQHQFRYKLKHVAVGLHDRIRQNKLVGTDTCIAFVDTSKQATTPEIAPIRAAKVAHSEVQGDFCVFEFTLAGFAYAEDLAAFNRQIRTQNGNLPHWSGTAVAGHFCDEVTMNGLPLKLDAKVDDWQQICKTLSGYPAYQQERMFYRLEGVYPTGSDNAVSCVDAVFQLRSGELYDVRLLHYSPNKLTFKSPPTNQDFDWLVTDADDKAVTFIGTKALAVDSDYDRKTARFRAALTTVELDARLTFSRRPIGATKPEEATWDFDLRARVEPDRWKQFWFGMLIGLPVALQGLVLTISNEKIAHPYVVAVFVVIAGFAAGLLATFFGPRKS